MDKLAKRRGTGEGSIYRDCRTKGTGHERDDHRGCRSYWVGVAEVPGGVWDDEKGQWVRSRPRVVRANKQDCLEALRELQRQVGAGVLPDRKTTVEQWLDIFLASHSVKLTPSAQRQYRTRRGWIVRIVGNVKLVHLRRRHVVGMLAALQAEGKSASTMGQALSLLRQAMAEAVANDIIMRNPCEGVSAPVGKPKTDDIPTPEEAEAIIAASADDRLGVLARLALRYGMRNAEMRGLGWSKLDIDGDDPHLLVARSTTKSDAGARRIPLDPDDVEALRQHRLRQAQERLGALVWADDDLVLTTEDGRALSGTQALDVWKRFCRMAGVAERRLHAARHRRVADLREAGVDRLAIRTVVGHVKDQTTDGYGGAPSDEWLRRELGKAS
jgi:integrase